VKALTLSLVAFAAAALLAAGAQGGQAKTQTLTIAMHDPGCHWFFVGGRFTKTASVTGSVKLVNQDEAALKVAGAHGIQRIPLGKSLVVGAGRYTITMVGQAPDDNHLKLIVH
jgi:hypothetical protein